MRGSIYPSTCAAKQHADRYIALAKRTLAHKGLFFVVSLIALIIIVGTPTSAHALFGISFDDLGEKAAAGLISGLLGGLLYILNGIGVLLFSLASLILTTTMGFVLSVPYTPANDNALSGIVKGWEIMRDFANMFFILILIAIGVGTMLQIDVRGKKIGAGLLIPFLVIATLINFTPILTGIVIDISNILTKFFFEEALGGVGALGSVNPFMPEGDLLPPKFTGTLSTAVTYVFELGVALAFNLIASLVLVTMAFLLLMRVLALWLLVIFSPLGFLAYILPQTRSYFSMWWGQFLQWSMLPIPLGLFLLLSSTIVSGGASSCNEPAEITELTGGASFCNAVTATMALGTIVAGMIVSFSTSAKGAGFIVSRAQGVKQGSINWANRRRMAAQGVVGRGIQRRAAPAAGAIGNRLVNNPMQRNRFTRTAVNAATLGVGGVGTRALGQKMQQMQIAQKGAWKQHEKSYEGMNFEQLAGHWATEGDADKKVAIGNALIKSDPNKINELRRTGDTRFSTSRVESFLSAARGRTDGDKEWYKRNPVDKGMLMKKAGKNQAEIDQEIQRFVSEDLTGADVRAIAHDNLENEAVALGIMTNDSFGAGIVRSLTRNDTARTYLDAGMRKAIDGHYNPATKNRSGRIEAMKNSGVENIKKAGEFIEKNEHLRRLDFLGNPSVRRKRGGRTAAAAAAAVAAAAGSIGTGTPPSGGGTSPRGGGGGTPPGRSGSPSAPRRTPPGGGGRPSAAPSSDVRFQVPQDSSPAPLQPNTLPGYNTISGERSSTHSQPRQQAPQQPVQSPTPNASSSAPNVPLGSARIQRGRESSQIERSLSDEQLLSQLRTNSTQQTPRQSQSESEQATPAPQPPSRRDQQEAARRQMDVMKDVRQEGIERLRASQEAARNSDRARRAQDIERSVLNSPDPGNALNELNKNERTLIDEYWKNNPPTP